MRRSGLYFCIAHLFDYPIDYDQMIYRFADFNAGHYASRNAAFQAATSLVSGEHLALDGDLLRHGGSAADPKLAERQKGAAPARAILPVIAITSPKITRQLTTEWFARRVDSRYKACLSRAVRPA
jgi:Protein of unknown function (DUF1615)